jgi:hypothetical protein
VKFSIVTSLYFQGLENTRILLTCQDLDSQVKLFLMTLSVIQAGMALLQMWITITLHSL